MTLGIVLITSDVVLRNALAHVLRRDGYVVFSAATAVEAQELVRAHRGEIGLAVFHGLEPTPIEGVSVHALSTRAAYPELRDAIRRAAGEA